MTLFDLETLLEPVEGEDPAGQDLAYSPIRQRLEQVFDMSISIDPSGDRPAEAEKIDWPQIVRDIVAESAATKDIWLAVYLARAGARAGSLETILAGTRFLEGLVDRYWEQMYPKLDDLGAPGRATPCESLASRGAFLAPLEAVPLLVHPRLGAFSGVDLERFRAGGESEDGYGYFRAALAELGEESLAAAGVQIGEIDATLRRCDRLFMDKAPGEQTPNFQPTYDVLARLTRAVQAFSSAAAAGGEDEADRHDLDDLAVPGPVSAGAAVGRIESRDDVIRALDAICDYYRRREPSSPVPLALTRARCWVTEDFMKVLSDIAPGAFEEAGRVLMKQPAPQEDSD